MSFALLALLSCGQPKVADSADATAPEPPIADQLEELSAPRLLRRASLDLRGVLPTVEELDAVAADPSAVDGLIVGYLDDPRLEERMVSLQAERWHTVMDTYEVVAGDYGLPSTDADLFAHSVGEEPMRLIARVIAEDAPWTEIVTSETTMANELLGSIWPVDYPEGATGWQEVHYTDGRPMAGVLSTNGMWWRYVTNISNKNRGRVAAISRLLLCVDILARPVSFTRGTGADPEEAIRTDPACQACHASVEPIAGNLFGFWWTIQYNVWEMSSYHPEREMLAEEMLGVSPGWYGAPSGGLIDLGWFVANDPRFERCGAQSNAELLWRRPSTIDDHQSIEDLRASFAADDLRPKTLLADILATPQYRAGAFTDQATDATRERELVERLLSPNQVRTVVEDLTGFAWEYQGYTQLENDVVGYRTLMGGVDGYSVGRVQQQPGLTWVLVLKRLAQAAATSAVARDVVEGKGLLLQGVDLDTSSGDAAFEEALRALHWRLYAEVADDAWVAETTALFDAVDDTTDSPLSPWEAVLEAALRDPRFASY